MRGRAAGGGGLICIPCQIVVSRVSGPLSGLSRRNAPLLYRPFVYANLSRRRPLDKLRLRRAGQGVRRRTAPGENDGVLASCMDKLRPCFSLSSLPLPPPPGRVVPAQLSLNDVISFRARRSSATQLSPSSARSRSYIKAVNSQERPFERGMSLKKSGTS